MIIASESSANFCEMMTHTCTALQTLSRALIGCDVSSHTKGFNNSVIAQQVRECHIQLHVARVSRDSQLFDHLDISQLLEPSSLDLGTETWRLVDSLFDLTSGCAREPCQCCQCWGIHSIHCDIQGYAIPYAGVLSNSIVLWIWRNRLLWYA